MRCLVTGPTGFIGKRLLGLLNSSGYSIRLISRSEVDAYETIVCNLGREEIPREAVESIDTIFHLAGFAHDMRSAESIKDLYYAVNVAATIELAELAANSGVKRFVFISSVKAGGSEFSKKCADEFDRGKPEGIYGRNKRETELKLLEIASKTNMHISIIRPSLVYGPNVKGNLKLMLNGIEKGWFPPLPEVGNQRSMIHVDDLVRAILLVATDKRATEEIFIATDGVAYSSRGIFEVMCAVVGRSVPMWSVPKFVFDLFGNIKPDIRDKFDKLFRDECYSSAKLEALGFKARRSLREINETDF